MKNKFYRHKDFEDKIIRVSSSGVVYAVTNWAEEFQDRSETDLSMSHWEEITPKLWEVYKPKRLMSNSFVSNIRYTICGFSREAYFKHGGVTISWFGGLTKADITYENLFNNFELLMSKNTDIISILVDDLGLNFNMVEPRIRELEELGAEVHHLCEEQCNGTSTRNQDYRQDKLIIDAEVAVQKLTNVAPAGISFRLYTNTDPRGYPFGIILPDNRSNNFGGIDWRLDIADEESN